MLILGNGAGRAQQLPRRHIKFRSNVRERVECPGAVYLATDTALQVSDRIGTLRGLRHGMTACAALFHNPRDIRQQNPVIHVGNMARGGILCIR